MFTEKNKKEVKLNSATEFNLNVTVEIESEHSHYWMRMTENDYGSVIVTDYWEGDIDDEEVDVPWWLSD